MDGESFFLSHDAWALRKYVLTAGYLETFSSENSKDKQFYCVDTFNSSKANSRVGRRGVGQVPRAFDSDSRAMAVKVIKVATGRNLIDPSSDLTELPTGATATLDGKLEEIFPRILSIVGNKPAMFFIDPSNPPTLSFNCLKPILRRKQKHTEILIKFDAEAIWQRAMESCLQQCGHTNRCTTVLRQLARVLGLEKLKHVVSAGPGAALVKNYMDEIAGYGFIAVAHGIRDAVGIRSNSYLIYCTRNQRNVAVMNNLLRSAEDRLLMEFLEGQSVKHPDDALAADVFLRRQELKHVMADLEKGSGAANLNDKEWRVLCERFGEFHQNDFAIEVSDDPEID